MTHPSTLQIPLALMNIIMIEKKHLVAYIDCGYNQY